SFQGQIADIVYWGVNDDGAVSAQNFSDIYDLGNLDITQSPPFVSIITPQNTTYGTSFFNFNVSLDKEGSVYYSLDEGANNISMYNETGGLIGRYFNATNSSIIEGAHSFRAYANDTFGNDNHKESVDFVVDLTVPSVVLNAPQNESVHEGVIKFNWTASDNFADELFCNLTLNSENVASNLSSFNGFSTTYSMSNLDSGSYLWKVTCTDDALNVGVSPTQSFTIPEPKYYVQRGTASVNGVTDVGLEAVITSKSFVTFSVRSTDSSPSALHVSGELINSTTLRLKNFAGGAVIVEWEVISSPDVFVQKGEETSSTGDSTIDVNIDGVNLSKSFILVNSILNTGTNNQYVRGMWTASFLNSSLIRLQRDTTGTVGNVSWQVISWDGANVQNGSFSTGGSSGSSSLSKELDIEGSFVVFSTRLSGATSLESYNLGGFLSDNQTLSFYRTGTGGTISAEWFVVEHPLFFKQEGNVNVPNNVPFNVTLNELGSFNRTFNWHSRSSTGAGTTNANSVVTTSIIDKDNLEVIAGTSGQSQNLSWQVIEIAGYPNIFNLNVFPITADSATINWETRSYSNSSVNYGTTEGLGTLVGNASSVKSHSILLTGLSTNTLYFYNVTSCNVIGCTETGPFNFTTFSVDVYPPIVTLISPDNDSAITNPYDLNFSFFVDDYSSISSCSLYVDEVVRDTYYNVNKNQNTTFTTFLENGQKQWNIGCVDSENNTGYGENRSVNINVNFYEFSDRWWETGGQSLTGNEVAVIKLNNSKDTSLQKTTAFTFSGNELLNMVNATTHVFGSNGAFIPAGSSTTFSSSFSVTSNAIEITWKLYVVNSTGESLICQWGDDFTSGANVNSGTISRTNSTCFSSGYRFNPSDRVMLLMNGYNTNSNPRSVTHAWDGATSSFVDLNITTEGFVDVNLTYPISDQNILIGEQFNATCEVVCSIGTCRSNEVYIQYNTSSGGWQNISSSGNLILGTGETNPHSLGNIGILPVESNFSLEGSLASVNNIRCVAISSNDYQEGNTTVQVIVSSTSNPPSINLTSPANGTWYNVSSLSLFYNATDLNGDIVNTTLILNGQNNITNQSEIFNGEINNFTITFLDGTYTWTVNATDSSGLFGSDVPRIFSVDTLAPEISLVAPDDDSVFSVTDVEFNFTPSDNLDSLLSCDIIIDSLVRDSLSINNGTMANTTILNLDFGFHLWNVTCIDDAQNIGKSTTRNFTISDVPPSINLTSPANGTWYNVSSLSLFYNVSDNDGFRYTQLILNSQNNITNQSEIFNGEINNFTITFLDGTYTWTVNATDSSGLFGSDVPRIFSVDTLAPEISLVAPDDDSVFSVTDVEFNFTPSDNLDSLLSCDIIIDSLVRDSLSINNGTMANTTILNLDFGFHLWNVTCIDDAQNIGKSTTRNFTISDVPPSINLTSPANGTWYNVSSLSLFYNVSDNDGFRYTQLILNSQNNITNQSEIFNGEINNFTITFLDGTYTWTVNATDTTNNSVVASPPRVLYVDTQGPIINLNLPQNNSFSNSSSVSFNFTSIDNLDNSLACNLSVGDVSSAIVAQNGTLTNIALTGLTDGAKLWDVTCTDEAENSLTSETRFINITELPMIQLNTANNSFFNISTFNLSYTPIDNTNLSSCNLYLDGVFNQTNQSNILNGQENDFLLSSISTGSHQWYVSCTDSFGLQNVSETRVFTVDLNGLNVELIGPDSGVELFSDTVNFIYNATDDFSSILSCDVIANSNVVDSFSANNGNIENRSVFFSSGGYYLWNVTCIDDAQNTQTSETRNFTLAFGPSVSLQSPSNYTFTNNSQVDFIYFVSDDNDNLANSTLILNGQRNITNQSAMVNNENNNFTLNLADGNYNWTVEALDLTGLTGTDSPFFITIDTASPNISLDAPNNDELFDWNEVFFNVTVSDNLDSNISCNLYINGDVQSSFNVTNGTMSSNNAMRGDGNYEWYVACTDDAQNTQTSEIRNFSIEAPPQITLVSPENESYLNHSDVDFVYIPRDAIGISECSIYLNDALNATDSVIESNQNNTFSIPGIVEGIHNWTVNCTDIFPDFNTASPGIKNFTVDLTPPEVNLISPENNINTLRITSLNFSVVDNLSKNVSCDVYVNGALNISNILLLNGSSSLKYLSGQSLGLYSWNVSCSDQGLNLGWSQTWYYNVTLADLMINVSDINFDNQNPKENESLNIFATISNLINVTLPNATVRFFEGDPGNGGVQIGQDKIIDSFSGFSNQTLNVSWFASLGTSDIYVTIDPENTIEEWVESNNNASDSITVGAWHFFHGFASEAQEFELATSENNRIIKWDVSNLNEMKIYVSDSESDISWLSLQALGRNTAGGESIVDFSNLDIFLNMSNFTDSVESLYVDGGNVKNTTSFFIFNKLVQDIPLAESINNSNFFTGILWDSSEDSDGFYGGIDKEDIIFVTEMNEGQEGAYGVYDYELRVPARLREYIDDEARRAFFYIEVN
ncbi:hypothetical protein COU60_03005, partial [Candidatus Pacearchaeota archaeon CG10_big_fil_rev_8_21_14_0_10_34_76]